MGRVRWLADRLVLDHWRKIDEADVGREAGPLSIDQRARVTLLVVALNLTFIFYIVLARGGVQRAMSLELPELARAVSPALSEFLYRHGRLIENVTWALGCFFFYFVVPALVVKVVFRERLRDHGLSGRGFLKHAWVYVLLFAPVGALVWVVSHSQDFLSRYPFYSHPLGWGDFLVWELFYGLQFFSLEFFFRGFMLRGLSPRIGHYAIFLMVVPYMMIHFQKPFLETLGAIIAGTVLGTLALRTRSIWGGVAIHTAVAFAMDVAALVQKGGLPGG